MKSFIKNIQSIKIIRLILSIVIVLNMLTPLQTYAASFDRGFAEGNDITDYDPTDTPKATCSTSGGTVTQLSGTDNREKIWNYLTAAGLSDEQAAGIMGNIETESQSSYSPMINEGPDFVAPKGFPGGGYGIAQWSFGRRDSLVKALDAAQPDLMAKYYNADYSTAPNKAGPDSTTSQAQGFVAKSASTGTLMPVADNDALLLVELNFLYQEATNLTINASGAANSTNTTVGEKIWDGIKAQTTSIGASNLWEYSYEISSDEAQTAVTRAANSQTIYNLYSKGTTGSACSTQSTNEQNETKQALAKEILASGNVSYWGPANENATQQIFTDIASGTNNGNTWPCGFNIKLLEGIASISKTHKLVINSSNRACVNYVPSNGFVGDLHYNGDGSAVDFGSIDGASAYTQSAANLLVSLMAPYMVNGSEVGQSQSSCLPSIPTIPTNLQITRFSDDCTHLHIGIPPSADPNLQCKTTTGCPASQLVK